MAILLQGVDPTAFGFLSGLLSVVGQAILVFFIRKCYGMFLHFHLERGKKLPVAMIGSVAPNFFGAFSDIFLKHLQISVPTLALVAVFAISDFSDTLSRLGIDYVPTPQKGEYDTVLTLEHDKRNPNRIIQSSGDPSTPRTALLPGDADRLAKPFLSAIENIALGESEFADYSALGDGDFVSWGGLDVLAVYTPDGTPLASMPVFVPLNCSENMVEYPQQIGFDIFREDLGIEDRLLLHNATVPNCTFTEKRPTGIYQDENDQEQRIQIVETVQIATELRPDNAVGLIQNGQPSQEISLTPQDKELARDRDDWKLGRQVYSIEGIQFGRQSLPFDFTVIGSGTFNTIQLDDPANRQNLSAWTQLFRFVLVSTVKLCPPLPSGRPDSGLQCFVLSTLECERFSEDIQPLKNMITPTDSQCVLTKVKIVWVRNYIIDEETVALIAGLYGFMRISPGDRRKNQSFDQNVLLAAAFALGTVAMKPSINLVVLPEINAIYISFMVLPVFFAVVLGIVYLCKDHEGDDMPVSSYHMLLFGKKKHSDENVPVLKGTAFPHSVNNRLVYSKVGENMKDLMIIDDPPRQLEDPLLRFRIERHLSTMSNDDDRAAWIASCVRRHVPHEKVSGNSAVVSPNENKKADTVANKVEKRFEFLDEVERIEWFRKLMDVDALLPRPTVETKKASEKLFSLIPEESETSVMMDDPHDIELNGFGDRCSSNASLRCSKKRRNIRDAAEKCVVCCHIQERNEDNHLRSIPQNLYQFMEEERPREPVHVKYKRTKLGCPGCDMVVCKDHWPDFSHPGIAGDSRIEKS